MGAPAVQGPCKAEQANTMHPCNDGRLRRERTVGSVPAAATGGPGEAGTCSGKGGSHPGEERQGTQREQPGRDLSGVADCGTAVQREPGGLEPWPCSGLLRDWWD